LGTDINGRRGIPTVSLVGNTERKGLRRRWENDIKTYLQEIRNRTLTHTTRSRVRKTPVRYTW